MCAADYWGLILFFINDVCSNVIENWDKILGFLLAVVGIYKYFDTRDRELAWKRTQLLFSEAKLMDTDKDMTEAVTILEGRNKVIKLDDLFDSSGLPDYSKHGDTWQKMDKLMNLLDRIAYAVIYLKTLQKAEAMNFMWYLYLLADDPDMARYCNKNGFFDILKLYRLLSEEEKTD